MSASADFSQIEKMLMDCAPGSSVRLATHSRVISYGALTYPSLPKFDNIEYGHIRKMVRFLAISEDCAHKHLPNVFKAKSLPKSLKLAASADPKARPRK